MPEQRPETGSYGGRDHIVVETPFQVGRISRAAGDALCKPYRKFWGLHRSDDNAPATCQRCVEIARRVLPAQQAEREAR